MGMNPTNTKVPCFNCSSRSMTCHTTCEKYLLYSKEREAVNANVYRQRMQRNAVDEYAITQQRKRKRKLGNTR
jgi:hypothetical protein